MAMSVNEILSPLKVLFVALTSTSLLSELSTLPTKSDSVVTACIVPELIILPLIFTLPVLVIEPVDTTATPPLPVIVIF